MDMDVSELLKDLEQLNIKDIQVDISADQMLATVSLRSISETASYYYDEVMEKLSEAGVKMGIDEKRILEMIDRRIYDQRVVIARGKPQEHGVDGYYEFFFDVDYKQNNKPKLRADGSVDYFSGKLFEKVEEGAKLAEYHQPTRGIFGFNVCGRLLTPRPGKPKSRLRGKGFTVSEDGSVYYAAHTGKVEYMNYDLNVSHIYDVKGNLDRNHGNIDFDGDVNITGSVMSGVIVHAMGNVYIGGHVEGATIIADKDITFKDGVNCKNSGYIAAKGNISGKYLENTRVLAGGDVKCGYILNSNVMAKGKVIVDGKRGAIIGGDVTGVMGVDTINCGHVSGTNTTIRAGVTKEIRKEYAEAILDLKEVVNQIDIYTDALRKYDLIKSRTPANFDQAAYTKVFQAKIIKTAERNKKDENCKRLLELVQSSNRAAVTVDNNVYPGCKIIIDDKIYVPDATFAHLRVRLFSDTIICESID